MLWSTLAFPISFIICVLSTTFTTAEAASRYYLMLLFVVGVGFALFMHSYKKELTVWLSILVVIYGLFSANDFKKVLIDDDNSNASEQYRVAKWMTDNGYTYGYATFDHANYITVMGNDSAKVRAVNNMADMEGCKWLTDSDWYPPVKPTEGNTCYIVTASTKEDFDYFIKNNNPIIVNEAQIDNYTIYVLDHDYTVWEK